MQSPGEALSKFAGRNERQDDHALQILESSHDDLDTRLRRSGAGAGQT